MNHSQRLSVKPLTPWVIAEQDGKIVASNCDCMAGLGESCSHVAALLWAIEAGVRIRDSMTVTDRKAYWVMPTAVKDVPYSRVKDIEFVGRKRSLNEMKALTFPTPALIATSSQRQSKSPTPTPSRRQSKSPTPAFENAIEEDMDNFFSMLNECGSKPVILSLIEPYASNFIPKAVNSDLPLCLSTLYKPEYLSLNYHDLLKICKECVITVSDHEAEVVEASTRQQSGSTLWFSMRTGRVTASRFKAAAHTSPSSPSISLIMSICHPELNKFKTSATKWGCDHERVAQEKYIHLSNHSHSEFQFQEAGLFLSTEYPFVGATPDDLVQCLCCNKGICEIKVSQSNLSVNTDTIIHIL